MKISTKGRYGLRAMLDLALNGRNGEPVCVQSISKRQGISESYLEQLISALRKAELIKGVRGQSGGYRLAKEPEDISVGDILRACEGDIEVVSCMTADERACENAGSCVTGIVWKSVNDAIEGVVDSITLKKLVDESDAMAGNTAQNMDSCVN